MPCPSFFTYNIGTMKKLILLGWLLVASLSVFAQQNLWKSQDIESAVVNLDHTVTFRFQAPNAQKVQIAGDFAEIKEDNPVGGLVGTGLIDMSEGMQFAAVIAD